MKVSWSPPANAKEVNAKGSEFKMILFCFQAIIQN